MQRDQLPALTSLRFFAAGAIVVFHMAGQGLMPFSAKPALAAGVSLFFVLSGFILTYNYAGRDGSAGKFYLSRFARLWPVHAVTLLFAMFMLPQLGVWSWNPSGFPIFLANVTLFQAWVPNNAYPLSFNAVSWSISVEMFFYGVFPLALMVKRLWLLALVSLVLTLVVVMYASFNLDGGAADPWSYTWHHVILHFPPMRLCEFLAGMAVARLFLDRGPFESRSTGLELTAVIFAIGSVTLMQTIAPLGPAGVWVRQCGSFFAFAVLIYVLASGNGRVVAIMSHPILVRLGEISFCTYMVHQIVIRHAVQSKLTVMWSKPVAVIATLIVAYAASFVLWKTVEVPMRRWIISFAKPRATMLAK